MARVIATGELLIDFATREVDENGYPLMKANPGGAPCNFLAALNRYGIPAGFLGKVGKDAFGTLLVETLRKAGIDTRGVVMSEEYFTTLAFVTFDESGDREFSFCRKPGADTQLGFGECDLALVDEAEVFHFGTLSLTTEPARTATRKLVAYAKEKGKLITFDPNLRKPLWGNLERAREEILWGLAQADVVKISEEEVEFLWGCTPEEGAGKLIKEYGISLAFVTLGPKGCLYRSAQVSGFAGCPAVKPVDTTGAGDIFGGSAVSGLLKAERPIAELTDEDLQKITRFACAAASLSTQRAGGISSVPEYEEVLRVLAQG